MENRYCVIMCGGIGSRFWPFSKTAAPKQFLDFFGTGRSLLQMNYCRDKRNVCSSCEGTASGIARQPDIA